MNTPCAALDRLSCALIGGLGRAVDRVGDCVASAKDDFLAGYHKGRGRKRPARSNRSVRRIATPDEQFSPILKDVKAICDISGLTQAIHEMNEISLKHSRNPLVARLLARIEGMSMAEREALSRDFLVRLSADPFFRDAMSQSPAALRAMTEADHKILSATFIQCLLETLQDAGFSSEDCERLQKMSDEISRPLNDLVRFYMEPKTFSQKVRRLWRMQRIFFRLLRIVRKAQSLEVPGGPLPIAVAAEPAPLMLPWAASRAAGGP